MNGQRPFTGYVLRESPDELIVLMEDSRRLVRVYGEALIGRKFCRQGAAGWAAWAANSVDLRPLITGYRAPPSYPRCSDISP